MPTLRPAVLSAAALLVSAFVTVSVSRQAPPPAIKKPGISVPFPQTLEPLPSNTCEQRRQAVRAQPSLPGVPDLEAVRPELVARAKAEPVVFLQRPVAETLPADLTQLRERLHTQDRAAGRALHAVLTQLKHHPKQLRQVVLTDGYLYAETPGLALTLTHLTLSRLFDEQEIDVTRGHETRRALKKNREYVWADGAESGRPAQLWLFDRISVHGEPLSPPKHVDVNDLRRRTYANRIELEHLTSHAVLATLFYGDQRVPALLTLDRGRLGIDCEVIQPDVVALVEAAQSMNQRRERVLERFRSVISEQVTEELPFDEPKTEEGQQDGQLRIQWRNAYQRGLQVFEFNGDEYPVFGPRGIPRIPQVCIDFITDSWERMAGTRWAKQGERRLRHVGRLDFDAMTIENRRRVGNLIDYAVVHPEWFEAMLIPAPERVAFADRSGFFRRLFEQRANFQPGDVVAILGPRDDEKLHYHSFFIVATDPVTSMPTLVAANAGRPRIRTWEGEMQNAPRRSIVARIRPKLEWLESIVGLENGSPLHPSSQET